MFNSPMLEMDVEGCNASKKSLDDLDSCNECDKYFVNKRDFEFHQKLFHARAEYSQEYTLKQDSASARRISQIIGAKVEVGSFWVLNYCGCCHIKLSRSFKIAECTKQL